MRGSGGYPAPAGILRRRMKMNPQVNNLMKQNAETTKSMDMKSFLDLLLQFS